MPTTTLTPDALDLEAARLYETHAWQQIVKHWTLTAPEPIQRTATGATKPPAGPGDWRSLLTVPVDQLIADTERTLPPAPPRERP
ncbi:hypothetical protein ACIRIW_40705, partial [Streptomyces sp. NPDC093269]